MFLVVEELLDSVEVNWLIGLSRHADFVDGKSSNPNSKAKNNLQVNWTDRASVEISRLTHGPLSNHPEVTRFVLPKHIAPPMMTKYEEGMYYGMHVDSPFMNVNRETIRSDISCTIFLHDPEIYEGGELRIHLGNEYKDFKLKAGSAILYPSNTYHEVLTVTRGTRLCVITFMESHIRDQNQRSIIYELNKLKALESLNMTWEGRTKLSYVAASLERMWSDRNA